MKRHLDVLDVSSRHFTQHAQREWGKPGIRTVQVESQGTVSEDEYNLKAWRKEIHR